MARIAGVDIPNNKRLDIALTYLKGIGRKNVVKVLTGTGISADRRTQTLTDEEVNKLAAYIEKNFTVEGELRQSIMQNIKRLREIGTYRGMRHTHGLPARGQRTKSNARTKRGKRVTVGALKKEDQAKMTAVKPAETK
jgi:small subunit ribosomal protein S13